MWGKVFRVLLLGSTARPSAGTCLFIFLVRGSNTKTRLQIGNHITACGIRYSGAVQFSTMLTHIVFYLTHLVLIARDKKMDFVNQPFFKLSEIYAS